MSHAVYEIFIYLIFYFNIFLDNERTMWQREQHDK